MIDLENRLTPMEQTDTEIREFYFLSQKYINKETTKRYLVQIRELLRYNHALTKNGKHNEAQDRYNCLNVLSEVLDLESISVFDWGWCRQLYEPLTKVMYQKEENK